MEKLIASSGSLQGLEKLLNEFYYLSTYKISENFEITNSKGIFFDKVFVKQKKNRYYLYHKSLI